MLRLLRPRALMLVKFDLWPNLVTLAHRQGVPTFLISATLSQNSGRFKNYWARKFFSKVYADKKLKITTGDFPKPKNLDPNLELDCSKYDATDNYGTGDINEFDNL